MRDVCRGATGCACAAPRRIAACGKGGTDAMTAVTRRIAKLENQLGTSEGTQGILYLVYKAGTTQADMDPDIQILRESGFLPTGRLGLVDFGRIPRGLNAAEREKFLRQRRWVLWITRRTALPPTRTTLL